MSETAANPYAAPAAKVDDVSRNPEAEAIRKAHISHEASIRAVGALYYLGSALLVISAIGGLIAMPGGGGEVAMVALFVVLAVGMIFVGRGVRALRRWARIVGSVLAAIGLLGFPIGTLINLYILYLFLSKKGRTVFSPEYQEVIAATPDIKYRTSIVVWIFLGLLALLVAAAVVVPLMK
jgi:hypothetical protein